jgi:hypothetical protein
MLVEIPRSKIEQCFVKNASHTRCATCDKVEEIDVLIIDSTESVSGNRMDLTYLLVT